MSESLRSIARVSSTDSWLRSAGRLRRSILGRAILSPLHPALLGFLGVVSLVSDSVVPFMLGAPLTEVLVFGLLPRSQAFRRHVERSRARAASADAERRRASLIARMSDDHRRIVAELQSLAAAVHRRVPFDVLTGAAGGLPLDELIDAYVRLAVVHDDAALLMAQTRRLSMTAAAPKQRDEESDADDLPLSDLARKRGECRARNEATLAAIRVQLAAIEETIDLIHERTIIAVDLNGVREQIAGALDDLDRTAPTIDSLMTLAAE